MDIKKPPDKYKTLKISLKKIINDDVNYTNLHSAIIRTHKLSILVYQFIRAYVLYLNNQNKDIPLIDTTMITMAFKVFVLNSRGPKPKGIVLNEYNKLKEFYNKEFVNLTDGIKIDGKNLSEIISYSATDMLTNIENNIKCHFRSYLNKFVNETYRDENKKILDELSGKNKTAKQKELNKEMRLVKDDLFCGTFESDIKYHKWITDIRPKILPNDIDDHECELNINPQKYLKYMITMNKLLEEKKSKQFQFFPLRIECVPKYVQLCTKSIIELFVKKNKNKYLNDIPLYKEELWREYFDLDNKIFRLTDHTFDYGISTDGFAVSIRFIHDNYIEAQNAEKLMLKQARQVANELYKGLEEEDIQEIKDNKKKKNKEKQKIKQKEYQKKKKEFKKSEKENNKNGISTNKYIEFPYFDKLSLKETEILKQNYKDNNLVYVDAGKRKIVYMVNNQNDFYVYSNSQRVTETKRLKYQKLKNNRKKKTQINNQEDENIKKNIIEIETELSGYNSKSCTYDIFKEYVKKKNEINIKLLKFYEHNFFRKLNWFGYINTKRSEDNLVNTIEKVYGKDSIMIYGDWNQSGKINYMSTPGIGIKRKIAERFKTYNIDEFRTSCLNYKTEERCENMYLPTGKDKKLRKIHAILTYQVENGRQACINRDKNAVLNMKKIVEHYFEKGERPYNYRRGVELEITPKITKTLNPEKSVSNEGYADLISS